MKTLIKKLIASFSHKAKKRVIRNDMETPPTAEKHKEYAVTETAVSDWNIIGESVVGLAHRRSENPVACQDAYCYENQNRVIIAVCDGAGSAPMSEMGSSRLSRTMVSLAFSLEEYLQVLLDVKEGGNVDILSHIIYRYAIRVLTDISAEHKRPSKDFRSTLLLFIGGKEYGFWLKVGDGEIVAEYDEPLCRIGTSIKGEYSNETHFVDADLKFKYVQHGLIEMPKLSGIALMTDGCSERLVSHDDGKIASKVKTFFEESRNLKLPREKLFKFFNDYEIWKGGSHDDKTLVVASR